MNHTDEFNDFQRQYAERREQNRQLQLRIYAVRHESRRARAKDRHVEAMSAMSAQVEEALRPTATAVQPPLALTSSGAADESGVHNAPQSERRRSVHRRKAPRKAKSAKTAASAADAAEPPPPLTEELPVSQPERSAAKSPPLSSPREPDAAEQAEQPESSQLEAEVDGDALAGKGDALKGKKTMTSPPKAKAPVHRPINMDDFDLDDPSSSDDDSLDDLLDAIGLRTAHAAESDGALDFLFYSFFDYIPH